LAGATTVDYERLNQSSYHVRAGQEMTADKSEDKQNQILDSLPEAELVDIPESNFGPAILEPRVKLP
jgi:hypothetical protein